MLEAIWHMIGSDLTVGLRPRVGYWRLSAWQEGGVDAALENI